MSTVEPTNTTPRSLPQDGTGALASNVRSSLSRVDSPGPDNAVRSAQTFDKRLQEVRASDPDVTHSLAPQQHYQTLPFIHPSPQSPPPSPQTQQQLTQLQWLLVQGQQREEPLQLQLEVMRQDLWQQKFQQQQLQQQLYLQQQHHPEQYFASQESPPSQEPLLMDNGSLTPTQPWASEVLC